MLYMHLKKINIDIKNICDIINKLDIYINNIKYILRRTNNMKREDAKLMLDIYKTEVKQGRPLYPQDMVTSQVLPKSKCQKKFEELRDAGFLTEISNRGANTYTISRKGLNHMNAYRDLRIEAVAAM